MVKGSLIAFKKPFSSSSFPLALKASSNKKGSQRNGGECCKQLRAYKKNKAGVMVSIVGFGRPKFKGAGAAASAVPNAQTTAAGAKICPTCNQQIR